MATRALITGITGQDGSYLAELLLSRGYEVWGLVRGSVTALYERLAGCQNRLHLTSGDLLDQNSLSEAVAQAKPAEIYHLAGPSYVPTSWRQAVLTGEVAGVGTTRMLEATRQAAPEARFYLAGSADIFGDASPEPQDEQTAWQPRSPYAVAKAYAQTMVCAYREQHGMFACTGIAFNHTSPRRGHEFVSRRISDGAARVRLGLSTDLRLGNLDARRDWGFAGDFVDAMHRIVTADHASDYVLGTGEVHTVRELVVRAFEVLDLPLAWEGRGLSELARDPDGRVVVRVDEELYRPLEAEARVANPSRARVELGWSPSLSWDQLITMMVKADYDRLSVEKGV
ncbi:MAG TPA: GDP-mannose 4,6-dehydratase [Armatimonadetes bacterium]|nr:GDP-mannose 4,6-dehydratase [Armatimonadota bacterium]